MYVFMDIEATGQIQSEAFQVAMVITDQQFEVKEMLNFYVEHEEEISPYVLKLCGLQESHLEEINRISYSRFQAVEIVERVFEKYSHEKMIFVGKMIKGDIKWLRKIGVVCRRKEFMADSQYIELNRFLNGNHKLEEDCLHYGITNKKLIDDIEELINKGLLSYGTPHLFGEGYHNAIIDAYAVCCVFKEIIKAQPLDLMAYVEAYDWTNRSYLMMNRKAMEDKIAVEIYRQELLQEIREEYGICVAYKKLRAVDSITFDNGCMMGITKKDLLLNDYLQELKRSRKPCFNHYVVRLKRGKSLKQINVIALNKLDLFIQLSKRISPKHIPQDFSRKSVIVGLLKRPSAYLEANGYALVSVKLKETHIDYKEIG